MRKSDNSNQNSKMVRKTKDLISIIFLSLVSLLSLSFCIGLLLTNASLRRQADASRSEIDAIEAEGYYTTAQAEQLVEMAQNDAKVEAERELRGVFQGVLEEKGSLSAIRELFPEDMIVASSGEYHFYPIDETADKNSVYGESFEADERGVLSYTGDKSDFSSELGVAVSRYQGEINFEEVKNEGVSFAMIRAGLRGSSEGTLLEDDYFESNIKAAEDAGLNIGVYFESSAIDTDDALEEATFVLDLIEPYNITYPVAILLELSENSDDRTSQLECSDYTDIAKTFMDAIEGAGYKSCVYGNIVTFTELVDNSITSEKNLWVNHIGDKMYYPYQFDLWEYSRSGKISGIEGGANLIMDTSGKYK